MRTAGFEPARVAPGVVKPLGAEQYEKDWPDRVVYQKIGGCTITLRPMDGQVIVDGGSYRCDVSILPNRIPVTYMGDYGPEAITAKYVLDYRHEMGQLPTDGQQLAAAQMGQLSALRGKKPIPDVFHDAA